MYPSQQPVQFETDADIQDKYSMTSYVVGCTALSALHSGWCLNINSYLLHERTKHMHLLAGYIYDSKFDTSCMLGVIHKLRNHFWGSR